MSVLCVVGWRVEPRLEAPPPAVGWRAVWDDGWRDPDPALMSANGQVKGQLDPRGGDPSA
jgi:hypothetical protein